MDTDDDQYYYADGTIIELVTDIGNDSVDVCSQEYNLFTYDIDNDGFPDYVFSYNTFNNNLYGTAGCDNCYGIPNNQSDVDGDGYGDVCDNVKL